jgi:two-component system, OmpR family, KDP operon response regulator KdpE
MSTLTLLVIDDEPQVRRFLRSSLAATGYKLIEAATGEAGLAEAASQHPDVILLDLGLPDVDGIEVTRRLREWTETPIIVLSARGQDQDKIAALDAGADDYLTKPFSLPELLARIRVAERHAEQLGDKKDAIFTLGDLRIDLASRVVTVGADEVRLTPTEYKLLTTLARKAGRVLTYQQLLKDVWGPRYATQKQYLHVYMGHLRNKLERDPARPRFLVTEPGIGYRLKVDVTASGPR